MNKLLLAGVALTALVAVPAVAADIKAPVHREPPLVYSWTGCYVGGNIGVASARQNANESTLLLASVFTAPASISYTKSGTIGGVHLGCNVEGTYGVARGWVFGIEGDWSAAKLSTTQIAPNLFPNGTAIGTGSVTFTENTKSLASIRGRAGVGVVPNVLLYATAGVVWNHTEYTGLHTYAPCPTCSAAAFDSHNFGWVAGGGLEWAIANSNWIARVEGLYYRVSGASPYGTELAIAQTTTTWYWNDLSVVEGRIGLSYKLGYY
jgi:outer membrane immunogenic protein